MKLLAIDGGDSEKKIAKSIREKCITNVCWNTYFIRFGYFAYCELKKRERDAPTDLYIDGIHKYTRIQEINSITANIDENDMQIYMTIKITRLKTSARVITYVRHSERYSVDATYCVFVCSVYCPFVEFKHLTEKIREKSRPINIEGDLVLKSSC